MKKTQFAILLISAALGLIFATQLLTAQQKLQAAQQKSAPDYKAIDYLDDCVAGGADRDWSKVKSNPSEDLTKGLNKMANDGWELFEIQQGFAYKTPEPHSIFYEKNPIYIFRRNR